MKPLLFVAAAAAASCTGAFAQSSVAIYGLIDVSANQIHFDKTPTRRSGRLRTLTSDASRLGFRGNEDLGGGLRAYFKLEHGYNLDTGTQTNGAKFWNREAYVGLGSRQWGSVQLGSQFSPFISASVRTDPFGRFGLGSHVGLHQGVRGAPILYDNVIQYVSPSFGGVSGKLLVAAGEGAATGKGQAGSLEYAQGPLLAVLVYDMIKVTAASVGLTGNPRYSKNLALGATYDFKVVKVHGWAQRNRVSDAPSATGYMLGLTVPVGVGDIRAAYVRRDLRNADASQIGLGYFYPLSKRTLVYGQIAKLENEDTAAFGLGPARTEAASLGLLAAGRDSKGFQIGVRHVF